jgi:RND family efflux transporter MFP subunit
MCCLILNIKKMKKIIIAIIVLSLVGLTAWKLSSNKKEAEAKIYKADPNKAVLVETTKLETRQLTGEQSYLGTFEPVRENKIAAEANGKVIKVGVSEGQYVREGQLIAKLDDEMMSLQMEAMQINLEGQQKDVNRYTNLAKTDAAPGIQLEKAELGTRATQAQMNQIKKQIRSTTITAPFSGIVTMRMFDLGSVVAPGVPLVQITDISSLKLAISVPERDLKNFAVGQSLSVESDVNPNVKFSGRVVEIAAKGDASHNFTVKVLVASRNSLRAGMYGSVSKTNSLVSNALTIPRTALVGSPKDGKVFVIENGKAILKTFSAGVVTDEYVEILSGLSGNEEVVVSGQINLKDGDKVSVK